MIQPSLKTLLSSVLDYAGLYPPASLPLREVLENYDRYLECPEAWMLNRLVLPEEKLGHLTLAGGWRISLIVSGEPGSLPTQVEALETKSGGRLSLPTYCEVPLDQVKDGYAKIRTVNLRTEALADFLSKAATQRVPFKATAGLHHPIRTATMHGFLNVFAGATFAWFGMDPGTLVTLLDDTDPKRFEFYEDAMCWRDWRASIAQIEQARSEFVHSFGSCSFDEPVNDLRTLGFLS